MHRFYAPPQNFNAERIFLDKEETRHLSIVLRLREGEVVKVFDGEGKEFLCRIERIKKDLAELQILRQCLPASESSLDLHLAVGLIKGEKFDLVIQKAVELGVKRLTPLITKRSDVRPSEKKSERWKNIIVQASKQCGRATLMKIYPVASLEEFLKRSDTRNCIMFSEKGGSGFPEMSLSGEVKVLVGPEGGWDKEELRFAEEKGILILSLGSRILRAETASIAAVAILQHRFGDLK